MKSFDEGHTEIEKFLDLGTQYWLLGAGVSFLSNIPLMIPLTKRVLTMTMGKDHGLLKAVLGELTDGAHIEHALSHLGDLIAIADRSKAKKATVGTAQIEIEKLRDAYAVAVSAISHTVRYGYNVENDGTEKIGEPTQPIVTVDHHRKFVRSVYARRANLEKSTRLAFFTTNYDTLLEDALAIEQRAFLDGFSGGGIGYWTGRGFERMHADSAACAVVKLHGSVDWSRGDDKQLLRVRYGVGYVSDPSNTLIYPQATKYVETQKDPFAHMFACFRGGLAAPESHLLGVCGYSFGDDHINAEIEAALLDRRNQTNLVAFIREAEVGLPGVLTNWQKHPTFGRRVYVATEEGIHCHGVKLVQPGGNPLNWWSFSGLTDFISRNSAS